MIQKYRNGETLEIDSSQDKILKVLYETSLGRIILKPLVSPFFSKLSGKILSCGWSRILIKPFIKSNNIDMSQFEDKKYSSYNEFFSRKIHPHSRKVDLVENHLISPSDSKLTVYPITSTGTFTIKHTQYTVESLLKDKSLAEEFMGGTALVFRLSVEDYHRYCYILDGNKTDNIFIQGILHSVNPICNDNYPIYKENSREYCIIENNIFGKFIFMEVGALMVGKIVNHKKESTRVYRGEEKGYFQFGGSTIVLLFKENTIEIDNDILKNSKGNIETIVKYGEKIGVKKIN